MKKIVNDKMNKPAIITYYREIRSIKATARASGISEQSVRRILIDAGAYRSPTASEVCRRAEAGEAPEQIAQALGLSIKSVMSYLPYSKGPYCIGEKSVNSQRIARHRQRKGE